MMKKNKFLSNFTKWVVIPALIFTMLPYSLNVKAGNYITKVAMISDDDYKASESIAINGDTVYCLRASTKDEYKGDGKSQVALYKANIDGTGTQVTTSLSEPVKVFTGGMLGHANDCTYYGHELFVAPRGVTTGNENYYGYADDGKRYKIVGVNLYNYSVTGYNLDAATTKALEVGGSADEDSTVSGITYAGTFEGNPKFVLKNKEKLVSAYLYNRTFHMIHSFTVNKPSLGGHSLAWQGVTYYNGYLYFGLGAKNTTTGKYDYTYIARKQFSSMSQGGTYTLDCYLANPLSSSTTFGKFETEGIAFTPQGYLWYIVNGTDLSQSSQKDAIYRLTNPVQ